MGAALKAEDIACVRGDRQLFSGANFLLQPGDALYVTGGNGAGKTSLLRLIAGLASPEHGRISWNGESIRVLREEYTANLLYHGHSAAIKDDLSAVENLTTASMIAGRQISIAEAIQALRQFGLKGREDLPTRVLSAGQRRRVNLARLLLPNPPRLWVLDEPFTALDAKAIAQLVAICEAHLISGGMCVYTTHQEVGLHVRARKILIEGGNASLC